MSNFDKLDKAFAEYLNTTFFFNRIERLDAKTDMRVVRLEVSALRQELINETLSHHIDFDGEYPDTNLFGLTIGCLGSALEILDSTDPKMNIPESLHEELQMILTMGKEEAVEVELA